MYAYLHGYNTVCTKYPMEVMTSEDQGLHVTSHVHIFYQLSSSTYVANSHLYNAAVSETKLAKFDFGLDRLP